MCINKTEINKIGTRINKEKQYECVVNNEQINEKMIKHKIMK